ncbi:DUF177 domain-containing protein [Pseudoruegeria sp. SK021]|uniref:YceD family protein n=1 Tax=Pseudoruegeria sp. SK021 TaxID=1933035 RepID=UPI000A21DC14|nr:DUF177 domain-containing protein [Pseudoruegeria sp. SK021]OSP55004.1 hypothetical protein BV911_09715 [Pseudoruegeria sp. SK021]
MRLSDLSRRKPVPVSFVPDTETLRQMAKDLDILDVQKARMDGKLTAVGDRDWDLTAKFAATVTQACVATLAPVRTRIEDSLELRFRAGVDDTVTDSEMEMPDDDSLEPLPTSLDLTAILLEGLSLALPPYPRVEGAALDETNFTEPGKTPLRDEDLRPFAGLADLKRKLGSSDDT